MDCWGITCDGEEMIPGSNLPYNDHNKIFYSSIKIFDKLDNDNICPFKLDNGFTIRPLKSSLEWRQDTYRGFKIRVAIMEVLIVSNRILEDNSIFDDSNQIVIGKKLTR